MEAGHGKSVEKAIHNKVNWVIWNEKVIFYPSEGKISKEIRILGANMDRCTLFSLTYSVADRQTDDILI